MKTKSKRVEKVEDSDGEIVIKKPKLSSLGRRKKRGDRLGTVELSNEDGFTTDEEEGEIEGQYEGCKHFEVESKHIKGIQTKKLQLKNIQDRVKTPVSSKKRKTLKKRTIKIKVEVKVKNKPGTVKIRLEDTAKLVKKKKIVKQKKEMKKLLDIESSSKDNTKLQRSKLEDKVQKDASHVVIKTDNVSNNKEQEKLEETDIGNARKRGRPGKIKAEKVEQNENLSNRGIETKIKERKRKSQETDPLIDTRKKKEVEQCNVEDDKIDHHLSISEGKTEKLKVDVEGKESNKSFEGKKKKTERRIKKVASVEVIKTENISENGKQQESLEEEILNVRKRGRPSKIKVEKIDGNENLSSSGTETKVKEGKGKAEKTNQEADPIIFPPKKGENKNIDDDKMDLPLSISGGKTVKLGDDVEEKESNKSIQENKKKAEEKKKKVASDKVIQTENISDDVKQPESQKTEIVNMRKRGRPTKIKVEKVEGNENLSSQGTETKVKENKGTTEKTNQEADPIIDPPQKGENKNIDDDKMDLPLFSISVGKRVNLGVDVEEKESNKSIQENKKKAEERKKKVASDEIIQTQNIFDDVKQPESQETEIVNMRKRGRPTKIKVEKVEQNENVSSLDPEIKVKERKRKGEKSNQEPIIETRKEEENTNVDDKINLPLSISVGKTEKFNDEVEKKKAKKSFQGKGKKGEECMKKDAADDLIKTENISDDVKQLKSLAKEIVNARKRGRQSKIKVEKVEENENAVRLGTESKVQERKGKGEKTNQEADPIIDLPKKEENKNINDDDKISISKGKTEKIGGDVQEKGSNKSVQEKKEKAVERKKKVVTDDVIKTENISDMETQGKLEEIEIVNVRKRGRPSKIKIKVEKVEENKNISTSSLGTETQIKERKIKGEKTIKETDTDTKKKEKNTNVDDKIDLHHSISDGKTEKSDVDVEGKESNDSFEGKKKKDDNTDNREKDTRKNTKGKKKTEEVVVDERRLDPNQEKFVGAHVSIAGGIYKSVLEAVAMKSFAFGLFLKSQRQWAYKPLEEEAAEKFKKTCQEYGYLPQYIVPHGSYLMNLGSPDENTLHKSRDLLIDDLQRCEKLGLTIFNFHPGSTCGKISVEKCLDNIAASIDIAHSKTSGVITVLENMSCQGHTIGGKFEELKGIIDRVKDKSRMGVCLDTCHAFAAGFDLSTEEGFNQMLSDFESIVGFQYLKALHINDSKGKLGCHLDRHENIGKGHIGKAGFNRIMNCPRFNHIPMILETPCADNDSYAKEVEMLYTMCNT